MKISRGYTWEDEIGPIRVMAVAEGYAMCRRPGALPFVRSVKEIEGAVSENCANGAHNFLAVLCAAPGCGLRCSGSSLYCKKHDMRLRRRGDISDRPRGRPRRPR